MTSKPHLFQCYQTHNAYLQKTYQGKNARLMCANQFGSWSFGCDVQVLRQEFAKNEGDSKKFWIWCIKFLIESTWQKRQEKDYLPSDGTMYILEKKA